MRYWVYKCNSTGENSTEIGDWNDVFGITGAREWDDTNRSELLGQIKTGDILIAHQTNKKELFGIVRATVRKQTLSVEALERIGAKMPALKKSDPRIDAIPAYQGGPVQTVYEISTEDALYLLDAARKIKGLVSKSESALEEAVSEAAEFSLLKSQGINSDAESRRVIERYAVDNATEFYQNLCYEVEEHGKPFDLKCTKGKKVLYVEVKGTQSKGEKIILTRNEVEWAHSHPMELYILSSIRVTKKGAKLSASGGEWQVFSPWRPEKDALEPLSYSYSLESE